MKLSARDISLLLYILFGCFTSAAADNCSYNYVYEYCKQEISCFLPLVQWVALETFYNETNNLKQMRFLSSSDSVMIYNEHGAFLLYNASDLIGRTFCIDGQWNIFHPNGTISVFEEFSLVAYVPEFKCNSCSIDLNYDTTLCDAVKSTDLSVKYCSPVTDTSQLFKIKENEPCKEQSVTFLTKTLKTAVFLPNGTMYRTAFPSDALKTKVSCSGGKWLLYDSPTKQSLEIDKLMIFREVCDKICPSNLNYDSTLCPKVQAAATNPVVTTCKAVENTTQLFTIKENEGCAQTVTFFTKTLKTAIFLPDGTLYGSVFASDALKDRVSCSNGSWIFYEKSTKKSFVIDKIMLFT